MTYEDIQRLTQLASLAIFASALIAAFVYAFRGSNRAKFDRAASLPLHDEAIKQRD